MAVGCRMIHRWALWGGAGGAGGGGGSEAAALGHQQADHSGEEGSPGRRSLHLKCPGSGLDSMACSGRPIFLLLLFGMWRSDGTALAPCFGAGAGRARSGLKERAAHNSNQQGPSSGSGEASSRRSVAHPATHGTVERGALAHFQASPTTLCDTGRKCGCRWG